MSGNQKRQWIKIDTIVNQYLDESEQSSHKFFRMFQIAFRGMENLGLDFFYEVKTVRLSVTSNYMATLPSDYLNYIKVGAQGDNGEIFTFRKNDDLSKYSVGFDLSTNNYYSWDGYNLTYQTSVYGNWSGGFKIDDSAGTIKIVGAYNYNNIVLEYLSSPKENGEYYVPIQFREALIAWMAWKDIQNISSSRKGNISDKRDRKSEFYNQRRLAGARYKRFDMRDAHKKQGLRWGMTFTTVGLLNENP